MKFADTEDGHLTLETFIESIWRRRWKSELRRIHIGFPRFPLLSGWVQSESAFLRNFDRLSPIAVASGVTGVREGALPILAGTDREVCRRPLSNLLEGWLVRGRRQHGCQYVVARRPFFFCIDDPFFHRQTPFDRKCRSTPIPESWLRLCKAPYHWRLCETQLCLKTFGNIAFKHWQLGQMVFCAVSYRSMCLNVFDFSKEN